MFRKTKAKESSIDVVDVNIQEQPHEHPMICIFDFDEEFEAEMKKMRFNYKAATFGATINVNNKKGEEKFLRLNYDSPGNLHEYDIVIMDFTKVKSEDYTASNFTFKSVTGDKAHALLSRYPEQVFDPRQLAIFLVSKELDTLLSKKSIIIAFCGEQISTEYQYVEINHKGAFLAEKAKYTNHSFYRSYPGSKNLHGRKVSLSEKGTFFDPLLSKHLDRVQYHSVFFHKTVFIDNKIQKDPNILPLLLNEQKEIVSYLHFVDDALIFVFPDFDDKTGFISSLLSSYLPEKLPTLFPSHGEFGWLDSGDYPLPGESELLQNRVDLEEKYLKDVSENNDRLSKLRSDFKFLSDLISETGDQLVSAIEHYLRWLEFDSVVNFDDSDPSTLEEDIQVDCGDRFLVIEVKGIGGTSTDKDCSQISKIRYRRAKQRGKFDVYGLYIVNHQRYLPPKSRANPPFTENQIGDALNDDRGLLTTYELYKAYFLIEEGILKKSDVRESLFRKGLIKLEPEGVISLGVPTEFFNEGQVAIVHLNDISIAVGDSLIVKKQGDFSRAKVISLQVNGKSVDSFSSGEVGIKFDRKLKQNSELFVKE